MCPSSPEVSTLKQNFRLSGISYRLVVISKPSLKMKNFSRNRSYCGRLQQTSQLELYRYVRKLDPSLQALGHLNSRTKIFLFSNIYISRLLHIRIWLIF